jgi:tetratricopeptide (TPR) repeat protein
MADIVSGGNREIKTGGGAYFEAPVTIEHGDLVLGDKIIQAPPTGVAARFQLPSAPPDFTGREAELSDLRAAIAAREAAAAISAAGIFGLRGQGGIGKTALALVLAHELAPQYPDAQIYLDLQGTTTPLLPTAVMTHVVRAFAPTAQLPAEEASLAAAYRSVLHGQRALLLFDNAAGAEQVLPLVPPATCLVLLTSRQRFTLPGLRPFNLGVLPRPESVALLLKIAPRIGTHADAIAVLCDDLPYSLRRASSALAEHEDLSPERYLARLRDEQGRLKELDPALASLALSYDLLSPALQAAWCALSVFAGDFDAAAAAAVLALDLEPASDQLSGLLRNSLVEFDTTANRYSLHDLDRLGAGARLVGIERASAERRCSTYFGRVLAEANTKYLEGGDQALASLARFDLERANIEAGQAWAAAHAADDDDIARLCSAYAGASWAIRQLRQPAQDDLAWTEKALRAARQIKDQRHESAHLGNLGLAYAALGDPRQAIDYHEQALKIDQALGDRYGEGQSLGNLGLAYAALDQPGRALEFFTQHLAIARDMGDRRGEANALGNIALAYAALNRTGEALKTYDQVLGLMRAIGNRHGEGNTLTLMAHLWADQGDLPRAIGLYEQHLAIARELGDRHTEASILGNLGLAYASQNEYQRAIGLYEQHRTIAREAGDRRGEADALSNLGHAYYRLSNLGRAVEVYEESLAVRRELGDRHGEAGTVSNLGGAYAALGDARRALECFELARRLMHDLGDQRGEAYALWNTGQALDHFGNGPAAIAQVEAARRLFEQIGDAANAETVRQKLAAWQSAR